MQAALTTTTRSRGRRSLEAHLRQTLHAQLDRLHENWAFAEADSQADAVHDLRVATRRLRAFSDVIEHALGTNAAHSFARPLKKVTRALGELRNADVLIALVEQHMAKAPRSRDRASLEHFLECLTGERRRAERKARKKLKAIDHAAFRADIRAAFEDAMRVASATNVSWELFGRCLVEQRTQDAIEQVPDAAHLDDAAQLHELRIAVKKLRYSLELFAPALDPKAGKCLARARAVQSALGEHHDLVVLCDRVESTLSSLRSRKRSALSMGLAKLMTSIRSERAHRAQRHARARSMRASARASCTIETQRSH